MQHDDEKSCGICYKEIINSGGTLTKRGSCRFLIPHRHEVRQHMSRRERAFDRPEYAA